MIKKLQKNNRVIIKIKKISVLTFFPLMVPTVLITSCTSNTQNNLEENQNRNEIDEANKFFPKIYASDYYNFVEFDNNSNPIINDDTIMIIIKDVVKKVATTKGKISFFIKRYSPSLVDINFKWTYLNKSLYKTYSLEVI